MINVYEIIRVIQEIPADNRKMKFLISLADSCFKFGTLTARQEEAYLNAVKELKEGGYK